MAEAGSSFTDQNLTCRDCGNTFVFTAGEQEFFAEKGFDTQPIRCGDCRRAKKQARRKGAFRGCFNCGQEGHIAAECTEPSTGGARGDGKCFSCGQEGHRAADCPTGRKPGRGCFTCGEEGHRAAECPSRATE